MSRRGKPQRYGTKRSVLRRWGPQGSGPGSETKPLPLSATGARGARVLGWTLLAAATASVGVGVAQPLLPQHEVRFEVAQGLPYGVTQASVDAAMASHPVRSREQLTVQVALGPMPQAQRDGRVPLRADALVSLVAPNNTIAPLDAPAQSRGDAVSSVQETDGGSSTTSDLSRQLDRVLERNLDAGLGPTAVVQVGRVLAESQPGRAWAEPGGWLALALGLGSAGGAGLLLGWPRRPGQRRRAETVRADGVSETDGGAGAAGLAGLAPLLEEIGLRVERMPRGIPGVDEQRLLADAKRLRKAAAEVRSWEGRRTAASGEELASGTSPEELPAATVRLVESALQPLRQQLATLQRLVDPAADASRAAAEHQSEGPGQRLLADAAWLGSEARRLLGTGPVNPAAPPSPTSASSSTSTRGPAAVARRQRAARWSVQALAAAAVGGLVTIPVIAFGYGTQAPESSGGQSVERVSIQGEGARVDQAEVLKVLQEARFQRPQHLVLRVDPAPDLVESAVKASANDEQNREAAQRRLSTQRYFVPTSLLGTQTALARAQSPELFDSQTGQLVPDTLVVGLWRLADGRLATNMTLSSIPAGSQSSVMAAVGSLSGTGTVLEADLLKYELAGLERDWPRAAALGPLVAPAVPADATGWVVFGGATVLSWAALLRRYPDRSRQEQS